MFKDLIQGISDLVYPPNCLLCKCSLIPFSPTEPLCPRCRPLIAVNEPPFCVKCTRPLGVPVRFPRCRDCRQGTFGFDFAWAAALYHAPLQGLIHQFKYEGKTFHRKLFGKLMIEFVGRHNLDIRQFDVLVPVPLSPAKLRERGFNQALILARILAREFRVPVSAQNLRRLRHTRTQTLLSRKERWTNLRGAFKINAPDEFKGKNILIIDDLLTTGATAAEASTVLKRSGAGTVAVFTLAIARDM